MRALLVDDESLVREGLALKLKLEDPSVEVLTAGSTDEARRIIEESQPDLVFLDVKFNGDREAGLRFLESLADSEMKPRVVMLSSETDRDTVSRAVSAGAVGFISKSDQASFVMRKAISMLLQGGVYISDDARRRDAAESPAFEKVVVKEVGPADLKITAPQVYRALWHISQGRSYKQAAREMGGIAESTLEEYARTGYNTLRVRTKNDFLVMLSKKGWKLKKPD